MFFNFLESLELFFPIKQRKYATNFLSLFLCKNWNKKGWSEIRFLKYCQIINLLLVSSQKSRIRIKFFCASHLVLLLDLAKSS